MAYDDWIDTEPKRYASKPRPDMSDEENQVYGWHGDGWYYMDENGMLCGGRQPNRAAAIAKRIEIKQRRQQWRDDIAAGKDPRAELRRRRQEKRK